MDFEIGDTVVLKSGGPLMTVTDIDGEMVSCTWFEKKQDKAYEGTFKSSILVKEEP